MKQYVFYTTAQQGWTPKPYNVLDSQGRDDFIHEHVREDTYFTPNKFKEPTSNTKDNLAELNTIVIDVDNHLEGITLDQAYQYVGLLEPHFNCEIPTPNKIIFTGRGLHFYISLEPTTNIAKHDLVSRAVFEAYDKILGLYKPLTQVKLSADRKAIGGNRFVRVVGTINTKSNTMATQIYANKAKYDLDMLIDGFLSDLEPIRLDPSKSQETLIKTTWHTYKSYRKEFTAQTWLYCAIDDLKAIQKQRELDVRITERGYQIGNEGFRNQMLFMYGLLCKWAFNDTQAVLESMISFNTFYDHGRLSEREVMATYQSVISKPYKPYGASKIIELLEIAIDEMTELKTLINKQEIKRRKVIRDKQYNAIRYAQMAQTKALHLQSIKSQAQALRNAGLSYRDIAKQLDISLGYAHKVCQY